MYSVTRLLLGAPQQGDLNMARLLLERGVDANIRDNLNSTPFSIACLHAQPQMGELVPKLKHCLFVCLFVWYFGCLLGCLFVCLFVCVVVFGACAGLLPVSAIAAAVTAHIMRPGARGC